jgi:hypothetical protein
MQHPMVKGKSTHNFVPNFEGKMLVGKTEDMKKE